MKPLVPYRLTTLQEVAELSAASKGRVAFDTETDKFYGRIRLLQAYHPSFDRVLMVEWPDPVQLAVVLKEQAQMWHNAHYDITTIQKHTMSRFTPSDIEDTFLLARLHYPRELSFSLDSALTYCLGFCPYGRQGLDKKTLQKSNWGAEVLTEEQLLYAATDVYYMPQLFEQVKAQRDEINYILDMKTLGYCLDFQWNGMPISQKLLAEERVILERKIKELALPINANSFPKAKAWMDTVDTQALTLMTIVAKGLDKQLAEKAQGIINERKWKKRISFMNKWKGDRAYGYFLPSTRSGRLASKEQNMQQLPNALKKLFEAREGKVLVYCDFSTMQLRGACAITGDRAMEKILRSGEDLHGFVAEQIFGVDYTPEHRQIAKQCNFNLLFGGSAGMLQGILIKKAGLYFTENECASFKRKWLNLWKEINQWQQRRIANWKQGRIDRTPLGRRYLGKIYTDQMNIEVQGFEAEGALLALHYMHQAGIKDHAILCDMIHDCYIWEADDVPETYEKVAGIVADSMLEGWTESCKGVKIPDLPMPIHVKVAKNWGDIEAGVNLIYEDKR